MPRPREFDESAAVAAAMEAFWSRGYEATSTADLCAATGLGRGSLYNAFGSKHALYEAALRHYVDQGLAAQVEILRAPGTPTDRLRALMIWVIDTDLADPNKRGCLAINASVETAGRTGAVPDTTRGHFQRLENLLTEVITEGQRSGEFDAAGEPAALARTFMSTYYGLRVLTKVIDDRAALLEVVSGAVAALH